MALNWRDASLSDYLEALEAFNAAHDPDAKSQPIAEQHGRLSGFMAAHSGGGNRKPGASVTPSAGA